MMIYSIQSSCQAALKILRSEFIAFVFPVNSAQEAQEILKEHQILYANATHNCYAYVLGYHQETQYYSDAGEPGGTAGKPILNILLRNDLSGVLAIVTRYYGGIKLGVKGLIEAYSEATQEAVAQANLVPYIQYSPFWIRTDYAFLETLRYKLQEYQVLELDVEYSESVLLRLKAPRDLLTLLMEFLSGHKAMGRIDFEMEDIP